MGLRRIPAASAFPLGALYQCDDCPGTSAKTYDAIEAARHRLRTGHGLHALLEVRDAPH